MNQSLNQSIYIDYWLKIYWLIDKYNNALSPVWVFGQEHPERFVWSHWRQQYACQRHVEWTTHREGPGCTWLRSAQTSFPDEIRELSKTGINLVTLWWSTQGHLPLQSAMWRNWTVHLGPVNLREVVTRTIERVSTRAVVVVVVVVVVAQSDCLPTLVRVPQA